MHQGLKYKNMANNRLYLVDTSTKEYLCIAKGWGCAWETGNIDLYKDFMSERYNDGDYKSNLIIGAENDNDFYNKWIVNGENYNLSETKLNELRRIKKTV